MSFTILVDIITKICLIGGLLGVMLVEHPLAHFLYFLIIFLIFVSLILYLNIYFFFNLWHIGDHIISIHHSNWTINKHKNMTNHAQARDMRVRAGKLVYK